MELFKRGLNTEFFVLYFSAEAYPQPSKTSKIELFAEIVIFAKRSPILDFCLDFECIPTFKESVKKT